MDRRLAAILAADVVGYSRLMGEDEEGTLRALKAIQDDVVAPKITGHQGRIFKTVGDGILAEFPSIVEAVRCAVELQAAMGERNRVVPENRRIVYRIGINLGDVVAEGDDVFGDGVNVAARLEGLADPGGICVSRTVRNEVRDRLPVAFDDMGEIAVKNIARPVHSFRVRLDGTAPPPARPLPKLGSLRVELAAAAIVIVATAVVAVLWWRPWETSSVNVAMDSGCMPAPDRPSLAVLPFANLSAEPDQSYFASGLGDDLITELSRISALFVIDRNSLAGYQDRPPQKLACDFGVRYVLQGSVQRASGRLRINVQLVDAKDGNHLWAERYDRESADVFAVQDDVIGRIVAALRVTLTSGERQHIARIPTQNLEAYDYYLRAETENFYKGDYRALDRALGFYHKAIELDPGFAEAHAGYARAAVEVMRLDYDQVLAPAIARKYAYDAAGRALALDAANARAYAALAVLQLDDRRHAEAVASGRRAVALNPNDAEAAANLAVVLAFSGESAEAVAAIEQAQRLNPAPPPGFRLLAGTVFFIARQYDRAIAELAPVRAAWPTSETAKEFLAAAYAQTGRLDLAKQEAAALTKSSPSTSLSLYRYLFDYFKQEQDLAHFLGGLKLAGFTDWPFGLTGKPEDQVTGPELQALVLGRAWSGRLAGLASGTGSPFVQEIDSQGRVVYRGAGALVTGVSRFDGDLLCMRFDGYLKDRWTCGAIYRNTARADRKDGDYLYLSPVASRYFTPKP
jgi:adenylate cyclase